MGPAAALTTFAAVLVMSVANAQTTSTCVGPPNIDQFQSVASSCPAFNDCTSRFCACASSGQSSGTDPLTCLRGTTFSCSQAAPCIAAYDSCLTSLTRFVDDQNSPCYLAGFGITFFLSEATSRGYPGSDIQGICRHLVCTVNQSAAGNNCDFGPDDSQVCNLDRLATVQQGPGPLPGSPAAPVSHRRALLVAAGAAALLQLLAVAFA